MSAIINEYLTIYPDTDLRGTFLYSVEGLDAIVQPVNVNTLLILYVKGSGITKDKIEGMGYNLLCSPETPAHKRLYRMLGFVEDGDGMLSYAHNVVMAERVEDTSYLRKGGE